MTIGEKIKTLRIKFNYTQDELASSAGTTKQTIHKYEMGIISNIPASKIKAIADKLQTSPAYLMGWEDTTSPNFQAPTIAEDTVTFPVIGDIAAGYDNIVLENWSGDTVEIPHSYLEGRKTDDFFVLSVKGDSMFPEYRENDKVLILKQTTMDYSGQVGAVLYDDEIATLKKVEYKYGEDWMRLVPINPNHPVKEIRDEALEHCRVVGVPKYLVRKINK